jgi:hypothetical protein
MNPKCNQCGSNNFLLKELLVPIAEGRISQNKSGEFIKVLFCADCGAVVHAFPFDSFDLSHGIFNIEKQVEYAKLEIKAVLEDIRECL